MSDLFAPRRARRSALVLAGSAVFALLAVFTAVEAIRGAPPEPGLAAGDATLYRACAAGLCAVLAVWIFVAGGPRRDDRPTLLR